MRKLLLLGFLLLSVQFVFAQKYSNEFLNIGVSARSQAMGGAQAASINNVTAGYWNPAGLTGLHQEDARESIPFQVSAMHAEWFAGIAQYDYLAFAKPLSANNKSTLAFSLVRFGIDQIPNTINLVSPDGSINYDNVTEFSAADYGFFISYAQKLKNENWSIGGSTKIIRRVIGTFGGAWGFGLDAGVQYKKDGWRFALMGRDITSTYNAWRFDLTEEEKLVFQQTDNLIPVTTVEVTLPQVILGGAYQLEFSEKYRLLCEANLAFTFDGPRNTLYHNKLISIDPRIGVELAYSDFLYIRSGLGNIQKATDDIDGSTSITSVQPNFGIGIRLGRLTLDYALTDIGNVSQVLYSNIFSLRVNFKGR